MNSSTASKVAAYCGAAAAPNGATAASAASVASSTFRTISLRTRGQGHGPITRLISPGDLGDRLKPFIFLDAFSTPEGGGFGGFGWHPHSGIATCTVLLAGTSWYQESMRLTDADQGKGSLDEGGVEYFHAARGAWHTGGPSSTRAVKGYQLWLSLSAQEEAAAPRSSYLLSTDVPVVGPARLVLGELRGVKSSIPCEPGINYLDVRLKEGESWTYETPHEHMVAFLAVSAGAVSVEGVAGSITSGELAVLSEGNSHLSFTAASGSSSPCQFMLGTAKKSPHTLHMGRYSVHTSAAALAEGEEEIKRVGSELKRQGIL